MTSDAPAESWKDDPVALRFSGVSVEYAVPARPPQRVLHEVSFEVQRGSIVALVGESGSGKSTLARTVTGTLAQNARIAEGSITFGGSDLTRLSKSAYRELRGRRIGYVPQDALLGLNPLVPVGKQAEEPLRVHGVTDRAERRRRVLELFDRVGLQNVEGVYSSYAHELSGGMCQRVLIAAAISTNPELMIADEPTTALDVTVQRRILDLLVDLTVEESLSVLLVTHDLGIAAERARDVAVLEHGRLVEFASAEAIIRRPQEEYTKQLIASSHLDRLIVRLAEDRRVEVARVAAEADEPAESTPIVVAEHLTKTFDSRSGTGSITALDDISLSVRRGTTLGIVGESGSGKTTLVRVLAGLTRPDAGTVTIEGRELVHGKRGATDRRALYRRLQMIYQNPYSALNPRHTVQAILEEPLTGFGLGGTTERKRRVAELLELTGLPASIASRFTAELSGGQRQRVAIARALAPGPQVLICDEPVSALDVTVQRQITELLTQLQRELGLTYLFISHDLGVISEVADEVLVLYRGRLIESGMSVDLLQRPRTEYLQDLIGAIPRPAFR